MFLFFYTISDNLFHQAIKPTVLIGSSGVGQTFTKEVVEAMTSLNEVFFMLFSHNIFTTWWEDSISNVYEISRHVETANSRSLQPNFTIWVHSWTSLYMEQGKLRNIILGVNVEAYKPIRNLTSHIDIMSLLFAGQSYFC